MNSKCKQCGSYQFNLHYKGIDQGDFCDVHYWERRALSAEKRSEEVVANNQTFDQLFWNYHTSVTSLVNAFRVNDDPETIGRLEAAAGETFHAMEVALYKFNQHSHTFT